MSRILISSIRRHTKPGEPSGFLSVLDWPSRRVTSRCVFFEPPHTHADPNPRGGMRGAKGLAWNGQTLYAAHHGSVFAFGADWRIIREISHPSCAGIHDLLWDGTGLWACSTRNDLLCRFTPEGALDRWVNIRTLEGLGEQIQWRLLNLLTDETIAKGRIDFRDPRTHRYERYDGAHVNSLAVLPGGAMLILLGTVWGPGVHVMFRVKNALQRSGMWPAVANLHRRFTSRGHSALNTELGKTVGKGYAALVRLEPGGGVEVPWVFEDANTPAHSLMAEPGGTVLLDETSTGRVIRIDPATGAEQAAVEAGDSFLRGICLLADGRVLAGGAGQVVAVDMAAPKDIERVPVFENPEETVYALLPLPDAYGELPEALDGP